MIWSLIKTNPWTAGGLAALLMVSHCAAFREGGHRADMACEQQKTKAALEAIKEKQLDDDAQADAGAMSDERVRREIARLNRQLEDFSHVQTGLACDAPGSGDSVRDAWGALFEEGLPAGRGGDDAGAGAGAAALEGR